MASDSDLFDRSGHLLELTLDRYRFDPPEPALHAVVTAHLATCEPCRAALDALVLADAQVSLAPPARSAVVIALAAAAVKGDTLAPPKSSATRRKKQAWLGGGVVLALAALVLFATRPWQPADEVITLKGSPIDFEIHVHDGERSRPVLSGDVVHPGERMGFRVHVREAGYLAIFGRDDRGASYPCYPLADGDSPSGAPVAANLEAVALARTEAPLTLPVAMRFDDILGDEHITAVFCEAPFALGAEPIAMAAELAQGGCHVREVTLHKAPAGAGP